MVLPVSSVVRGLESVEWRARCQVLSETPLVVLDSAHNPAGAQALLGALQGLAPEKELGVVLSVSKEKDAYGLMRVFAGHVAACWLASFEHDRMMTPDEMRSDAEAAGLAPRVLNLADSLREGRAWAAEKDAVLCVAGSIYLAGAVLALESQGRA